MAQCLTGAVLLARPHAVASAVGGGRRSAPPDWLVRLLGGRLVLQGGAVLVRPDRATTLASAAVDATHALSMVGAAVISARHRRPALISAAVATASAVASAAVSGRPDGSSRTAGR